MQPSPRHWSPMTDPCFSKFLDLRRRKGNDMTTENIESTRQVKAVGKGSVVLGAVVPLQVFATLPPGSVFTYNGSGTATQIRCGVSGMTSGLHSRDTTTTTQCMGYSPGWYKTHAWPSGVNKEALITTVCSRSTLKTYACTTKTTTGSGRSATTTTSTSRSATDQSSPLTAKSGVTTSTSCTLVTSTLFDVISFHDNTDEFHWVCAWLNGMGGAPASWNFPYTGAQVINLYSTNSNYPSGKSPLDFFKTYMEKHP